MSNLPQKTDVLNALRGRAGLVVKQLALLLAASFLLTGCVRYDVRLNNGTSYTNVRKPVYNKETDTFTIKSVTGQSWEVKSAKINEIKPHESLKSRMGDHSNFLN